MKHTDLGYIINNYDSVGDSIVGGSDVRNCSFMFVKLSEKTQMSTSTSQYKQKEVEGVTFEVTTKRGTPGSAWDRDELGSVDTVRSWPIVMSSPYRLVNTTMHKHVRFKACNDTQIAFVLASEKFMCMVCKTIHKISQKKVQRMRKIKFLQKKGRPISTNNVCCSVHLEQWYPDG